ncbi:MAG: hypothetical protein R2856_28035 [Caldilineaceae bacterium]
MPRRPKCAVMEEKGARLGCIGDQISCPSTCSSPATSTWPTSTARSTRAQDGRQPGHVDPRQVGQRRGPRRRAARPRRREELPNFVSFFRGFHPTYASPTIMLLGVNCPTRIGSVTVMPGDVVLGRKRTASSVPKHLAEKV